ncbi:MAG TPA: hypothetical protein PK157_21605 [Bryobacteraceae bacterium]|nr:hypothetical protein [Bryobacteraceae bacterium]
MADSKLELVVTVDADKANASIKSVNAGLSSIETTALSAARGASRGIDGMTAAMVKGATAGNLLADAIKTALSWAKAWTIDAAKLAAHEARLEASTLALARAHGVSEAAALKAVEAIRKIGYHGEEALHTITRFIAADMDLAKVEGLAKLAKDAAAIENIAAGEALEKLLMAVEGGYSRGLRTMGLFVNLEKELALEELRRNRALTEAEQKQVRYNAIMREGAKIQGAHAAASGEAEMMLKALGRQMQKLREQVGARFQKEFKDLIKLFKDAAQWATENADTLAKFGRVVIEVATVLATYQLAKKIAELAGALSALSLASVGLRAGLIGAGIAALGFVFYEEKRKWDQRAALLDEEIKRARVQQMVRDGRSLKDLEEAGFSREEITYGMTGKKYLPWAVPPGGFELPRPAVRLETGPTEEELKLQAEIRKRQAEAARTTLESALAAEAEAVKGPARALLDIEREAQRLTTFVDERGVIHRYTLVAEARHNLERELQAKLRALQKESIEETWKRYREEYEQRLAWETELYQRRLANDEDTARRVLEHTERVYGFEEQRAGWVRDAQLRQAEATDAQTIEQKVALEQRKMEIEVAYLERVNEIKQRLFDMETSRMVLEEEANLRRLGYRADEIRARIGELTQQREEIRRQQQEAIDAAVQAARENAAIRQTEMIRDHNRQIFESLKRQAEGVFDALLTKSQSVWSAIGNALKTAILTAIKEIVSSRVAALLMQLFSGARVPIATGVRGSRLGALLGIGAAPVFGGGGPIPGGSAGGWGTPPFVPAGAGWRAMLGGWREFLGIGGSIQLAPGVATTWQAATLWQKLSAIGRSPAAALGGGLLALAGLQRGGLSGLAMTTAGGALVGFKYGGPLGAAIGAGVGAIAGIARLFVKSAEEKAREKIKATYGVDIRDKGILRQIVETARQTFGGNLDAAIRSQQVRDLVELYAMATGQSTAGLPPTMRPVSLLQQGGALYQQTFTAGAAPSLDRIAGGTPASAGPTIINISVPGAKEFFEKETVRVVLDNPRTVQASSLAATKANAGRRELVALQLSPGTLTA